MRSIGPFPRRGCLNRSKTPYFKLYFQVLMETDDSRSNFFFHTIIQAIGKQSGVSPPPPPPPPTPHPSGPTSIFPNWVSSNKTTSKYKITVCAKFSPNKSPFPDTTTFVRVLWRSMPPNLPQTGKQVGTKRLLSKRWIHLIWGHQFLPWLSRGLFYDGPALIINTLSYHKALIRVEDILDECLIHTNNQLN